MRHISSRTVIGFAWIVMVIGMVVLALHPSASPPSQYGADKVVHFIAFAIMVGIPMWLVKVGFRVKLVLFILLMGMGGGIEYVQSFVPGRTGSLADALANFAGGVFGTVLGLTKVWQEKRANIR